MPILTHIKIKNKQRLEIISCLILSVASDDRIKQNIHNIK